MFIRKDVARVASASTGSQAMWLYLSETDTLSDALVADYFGEIAPQLRFNDVLCCRLSDRYCWLQVSDTIPSTNSVTVSQIDFITPTNGNGQALINWRGTWQQNTYEKNDQVTDNGWLMIANKTTVDKPSPIPTGEPFYVYDGSLIANSASAKQILFGTRYSFTKGGYLNGYRIDVVEGNSYQVFSVIDPLGDKEISELIDFVAKSTGFVQFGVTPRIVQIGDVFDLVVLTKEPAGTPTITTLNYDYRTPIFDGAPNTGEITNSNAESALLNVHFIDDDGQDRTVFLSNLTIGDIISGPDVKWNIQAISIQTNYITFSVTPAAQQNNNGVQPFDFETVVATPIAYGREDNFWNSNANVQGLFVIDESYDNIVVNENAYGTDILVQNAYVSPDWGYVSYSEITNQEANKPSLIEVARYTSFSLQQPSATDTVLQLTFGTAQGGPTDAIQIDANGLITFNEANQYPFRIGIQFGRNGNPGASIMFGRALFNGVQIGNSVFAELDDSEDKIPTRFTGTLSVNPGDTLAIEIYRDSAGVNQGGIFPATATLAGWNDAPSCFIIFDKFG